MLFQPYKLNSELTLKNRIIMAPMTRACADKDYVPTEAMKEYYAKRADAGLIVTECTSIRLDGRTSFNAPGIFTQAQIEGWKKVTDAVHHNNGLIFNQIWHVGRASHPSFTDGNLPIGPSATEMTGRIYRTDNLNYGKNRALSLDEIKSLVASYAQAAKNALAAGFDGVEIHGANGYLIDQFLHYHTNLREDEYGGSPENVARFALEIVKACAELIGYERVGLRLSPGGYLNQIVGDARDAKVFDYLLKELNKLPIAYVHTGNFDDSVHFQELHDMEMTKFLRQFYKGTLIGCGSYSVEKAVEAIEKGEFDLIAFGRPFIANPDLVDKIKHHKPLTAYNAAMLNTLV